jgi:tRNA A-37 threonylcarbamoyl transferase component Bud32
VSGRGRRTNSGFLATLIPRFDAEVSLEFYRLSGKLRAITNVLFLITNFALAPQVEALGFDPVVFRPIFVTFFVVHTIDGCLGVWLWRGNMNVRRARVVTYACVCLETIAAVFASWVYGSVSSMFIGVELVFILIYRLAFDFRIGVTAFALIFLGQALVVALELAGVIPPQPVATTIDGLYAHPARELGAMLNMAVMMALTFVVSNWAVGRLHHKDIAIRLLRESLYAADHGSVGRHTGRTLRETYALGALLGRGGMGEVYAATHLKNQRRVAVKLLHAHLVEDSEVLARFRREAEITSKLGSDHIVRVIDVDQDQEQPFLVLELVEGESLNARLNTRGPLPLDEVASIVEQIATGLDLAHQAGIVHRDLKPENLFLCPRADGGTLVKILDFGVSKIRGNATALTGEVAILGTPEFMSPEQALGRADEVEAPSDLFALGGIAYVCLTGKRPFSAKSVPALLRQICDDEPTPISALRTDVPAGVCDVVVKAMAKQPKDRYATAGELARDFNAASEAPSRARRRAKPPSIDVTGETHRG